MMLATNPPRSCASSMSARIRLRASSRVGGDLLAFEPGLFARPDARLDGSDQPERLVFMAVNAAGGCDSDETSRALERYNTVG